MVELDLWNGVWDVTPRPGPLHWVPFIHPHQTRIETIVSQIRLHVLPGVHFDSERSTSQSRTESISEKNFVSDIYLILNAGPILKCHSPFDHKKTGRKLIFSGNVGNLIHSLGELGIATHATWTCIHTCMYNRRNVYLGYMHRCCFGLVVILNSMKFCKSQETVYWKLFLRFRPSLASWGGGGGYDN